MTRPRLLLTNDDGFDAAGLADLAHALAALGELHVVAPAHEMSASGQSVTTRSAILVEPASFNGAASAWRVHGTPTDCVRLALRGLLEAPPELVISGVNPGFNVGLLTRYSGTLAAALEGSMSGLPAVAFSLMLSSGRGDMLAAAEHARLFVERWLATGDARPIAWNVNFPSQTPYRGFRLTRMCTLPLGDGYHRQPTGDGRLSFKIRRGEEFVHPDEGLDSELDLGALRAGWVSVTPLWSDLTCPHVEGMPGGTDRTWNLAEDGS